MSADRDRRTDRKINSFAYLPVSEEHEEIFNLGFEGVEFDLSSYTHE